MEKGLFDEKELGEATGTAPRKREEVFNDYEGFVEKFKPKKTTDDCYTPPHVYECIKQWVNDNLLKLDGIEIVRPFYPGGDFESFEYPDGCLVLDNPPFSILARIRRFYHAKGIKYFLFAPSLTLCNSAKELEATFIVANCGIIYENGADINTSFVTNIECDYSVWVAGDLCTMVAQVQKEQKVSKKLPRYVYPPEVISSAILGKIADRGLSLKFPKNSVFKISKLDSQKPKGGSIYGGGWLISERMAAERMAAERMAAERMAAERMAAEEKTVWSLSEREKEIIRNLK